MPSSPVQDLENEPTREPEEGIALCLSGGGYRAMLFHTGVLWRLNEARVLQQVKRISSVSGGSITNGVLALNWSKLEAAGFAKDVFADEIVAPIRELGSRTIDVSSVALGSFWFGSVADKVADAYRKYLFGKKTLQDIADNPRFVFNATNMQSGVLWRFMKPYMRDYRVGEVKNPTIELAVAVAASSAFPPVLSPMEIDLNPNDFTPGSGTDLQDNVYRDQVVLSDGGVYDNLGLETAWKRYKTILVSDAGGGYAAEADPHRDWVRHSMRVLFTIDNQVRSLRKRQVVESYLAGVRSGAYWSIASDLSNEHIPGALSTPYESTKSLAGIDTRLKKLDGTTQQRLINWGYAACDVRLRRFYDTSIAAPGGFPYPIGV